jgi:hypothetical protein
MKLYQRYGLSILLAAVFLGLVNLLHFLRPVTCWDCFFPYGLPFTFFREGGYAGGGGVVWSGMALDLLVLFALGAAISSALGSIHKGPDVR